MENKPGDEIGVEPPVPSNPVSASKVQETFANHKLNTSKDLIRNTVNSKDEILYSISDALKKNRHPFLKKITMDDFFFFLITRYPDRHRPSDYRERIRAWLALSPPNPEGMLNSLAHDGLGARESPGKAPRGRDSNSGWRAPQPRFRYQPSYKRRLQLMDDLGTLMSLYDSRSDTYGTPFLPVEGNMRCEGMGNCQRFSSFQSHLPAEHSLSLVKYLSPMLLIHFRNQVKCHGKGRK